jgi:hypothetical protein
VAKSKPRSPTLRVVWPDPPPAKSAKRARKKTSKPAAGSATQGKQGKPQAADGSTVTATPVPHLPAGLPRWDAARLTACRSIAVLEARAAAIDAFLIDLGLACEAAEDALRATQRRLKALRAAKRRPPRKPR